MPSFLTNSILAPCSDLQGRCASPRAVAFGSPLTAAALGACPDIQVGTVEDLQKGANQNARLLHDILLNWTHNYSRHRRICGPSRSNPRSGRMALGGRGFATAAQAAFKLKRWKSRRAARYCRVSWLFRGACLRRLPQSAASGQRFSDRSDVFPLAPMKTPKR